MSNGEAKRWWIDLRPHSNARAQGYSTRHSAWSRPIVRFGVNAVCVMPVEDHERIVAELKAEYEQLQAVVTAPQMQYEEEIAELRAEIAELSSYKVAALVEMHQIKAFRDQAATIATQKRVIEKLKLAITDIANKNTCWRLYEIDKYKSYEDGWEGVAEFAGKVLNELEAIEKGEA